LKRLAGQTDLAGPLLLLASAASAYLTGAALLVDGGLAVGSI
jgi:NAD(P)-dependent dehydrogenase (short-subunit alcohol dehydrogenase family)